MSKESKHLTHFRTKHSKDGEVVMADCDGYIGNAMGKKEKSQFNGVLIVTDTRLVFCRKGFFGEVLESIEIKNISSIERKSFLGHRVIRVHTSHDDLEFKTFNKDGEVLIANAIEKQRNALISISPDTKATENDALEKIKRLAELRDQGIVTNEEFEAKKHDLLQSL